jgi:hypothetical protein
MGGLHVIFVGDLFQLKPVKDGYVFEDLKSGFNALGGNLWADNIVMYELYEQMRQKNARVFGDRLKRLREGEQTQEDIAFFETLVIDRNNPPPEYNVFIKHLFATNKELDDHNARVYDRSDSLALLCPARDTFLARSLTASRRQILTKVLDSVHPKKFYGLHQTLNLRVGLMVEVVVNEDVSDGIFNGAYGHLRSVTLNENDVPSRLWVEFANERIGQQLRKRFGSVKSRVVTGTGPSVAPNEKWTALYPVSRCHRITPMQDSEVRRVQFPVRPATACTFNRAQGSTLSIAAMDFRGMPSAGRHYVGLSRLTAPEILFLFNFAADSIRTAPQVKAEMKRMRDDCRVQLFAPNLSSNAYPTSLTLLAHNAMSLHAHVAAVRYIVIAVARLHWPLTHIDATLDNSMSTLSCTARRPSPERSNNAPESATQTLPSDVCNVTGACAPLATNSTQHNLTQLHRNSLHKCNMCRQQLNATQPAPRQFNMRVATTEWHCVHHLRPLLALASQKRTQLNNMQGRTYKKVGDGHLLCSSLSN